jgi:hypothetical protein
VSFGGVLIWILGLALVAVVALGTKYKFSADANSPKGAVHQPVVRSVPFFENVRITDYPFYVNGPKAMPHVVFFNLRQRMAKVNVQASLNLWPHDDDGFCSRLKRYKGSGERVGTTVNIGTMRYIIGRGLACIFNTDGGKRPNVLILNPRFCGAVKGDRRVGFTDIVYRAGFGNIGSKLASAIANHDDNSGQQPQELSKSRDAGSNRNSVAQGPRLVWIIWSCCLIGLGFTVCLFAERWFDSHRYLSLLILVFGCTLAGLGYALWLPESSTFGVGRGELFCTNIKANITKYLNMIEKMYHRNSWTLSLSRWED